MVNIETFRQIALSFPETTEQPHFEKTSFRVNKKIFATLDIKKNLACLMFSEIDQSVFAAYDNTIINPVPNKWGERGATYIDLKKIRKSIFKEALITAYCKVAPARLSSKLKGNQKITRVS